MPELPEVEHLRRTLASLVIGRTVIGVRAHRRDVIAREDDPAGGFSRSRQKPGAARVPAKELLVGDRVVEMVRHGKQLAVVGDSGRVMCVHLGMTGTLLHARRGVRTARADHVHIVWRLDDGSRVLFRDPRRFGGVWLLSDLEALRARRWNALGPDALDVSARALHARLGRTRRVVKGALLDQRVIAGVGNIYADESLFLAGLHPARAGASIGRDESARLARAIRRVLRGAIDAGGSTLRDYADARGGAGRFQHRHTVYGRGGLACRRCGGVLDQMVLAQRATVWCPVCQPLKVACA